MVFCTFSLPFLSFVKSFNQIRTQRKQLRMFFGFYRSALPVFLLFSICFFSFILTLFFPALYNNLCVKTTLNLVTLVSQETGDKKKQRALWCYNARSVANHIADFALLIL